MPIKVYLADGYSLFRKGLKYILENECNVRVVGEFDNNSNILNDIANLNPDVVIVSKESYSYISKIREADSNIKFIYIEDNNSSVNHLDCDGYILDCYESDDINKVLSVFLEKNGFVFDDYNLTSRELQVLKLLSNGLSNKEIANKLSITERTTKNHISSVFKKIHVNDRTQATLFAIRNKLVRV